MRVVVAVADDVIQSSTGVPRRAEPPQISQLRIRNVTVDDCGLYVCTATNGFGTVRAYFQLIVRRTYVSCC